MQLEHFLIETLCVSIHTPPTLRGKNAVFPLAYGAGVRYRVRQSDCHFQWHFALIYWEIPRICQRHMIDVKTINTYIII